MESWRPVPHEQRVEELIGAFERQFGRRPEGIAEAPGRVNLIGEHVDYNDGLVLPFAIDRSVMCAWAHAGPGVATVGDATFTIGGGTTFESVNAEGSLTYFDIAPEASPYLQHNWLDYPVGTLWALVSAGFAPWGCDLLVAGDLPQGAGLSSSAALELSIAGALRDAFALAIDDGDLARLCQRAENEYVGVQCGIMDQFASALSKRGHALLIDCRTLEHEHVPLRLAEAGLCVVIANSGVKRELASSAYNERRRECEEAVLMLQERLGRPDLTSLRDVTRAELDSVTTREERKSDGRVKRAKHVIGEITRVRSATHVLKSTGTVGWGVLGYLMGFSHLSLRDNFEVSCAELDLLYSLAIAQGYVFGARLTGAGFGGCTLNIVRADAVDAFERDVMAVYRERTGLAGEMYVVEASDGLRTWRV